MSTASKGAVGATQDWKSKLEDKASTANAASGPAKANLNPVQPMQSATPIVAKAESALAKAEDWTAEMAQNVEKLDGTIREFIGKRAIPMAICAVGAGVIAALVQNRLAAAKTTASNREAK